MFHKEFFAGNRQRLRQSLDSDTPIIVTANGHLQRNGDNTYKFRQDSNFWYLTGIPHPDILLVMDKSKEYLIVPGRDRIMEAFDGSIDPDDLTRISGIGEVLDEKAGWKRLAASLKDSKAAATVSPPPPYLGFYSIYTNPARAALVEKVKACNDTIEITDLREHFGKLRVIKQAPELAAIRQAVEITIDSLLYVTDRKRLKTYTFEYELEADITRHFRRSKAGHAFDPIVANGARACQLHYIENSGPVDAKELIVFDVGAEVELYAADIARTVIAGQPSKRQEAIYTAVCEVQDYAYSLLKPGVVNVEYEELIEKFMGEKLRELKIINKITKESVRKYFPHMTTHFLGLEAHDIGDYHQPMRPGMTMVVEPGIYVPEEGIGVRIEDDVLITEDGCEILSRRLPRQLR